MKISDLDGNVSDWKLTGHTVGINNRQSRSQYHLQARELLKSIYPTLQLLEEVSIPIRKGETLYLDFYLPLLKKCVEVHGEQHYKFIPFFHSNNLGFFQHQKRDREKAEWCELNNIDMVVFKYDEQQNWPNQL